MDNKEDKRFAHVASDPRFRSLPNKQRKVVIDERFTGMFSDERFKLKYTSDKRGRHYKRTTDEDLRDYYHLSRTDDRTNDNATKENESERSVPNLINEKDDANEESSDSEEEEEEEEEDSSKNEEGGDSSVSDDGCESHESDSESDEDYRDMSIRGGGDVGSSSSSDDDDDNVQGDADEEQEPESIYYSNEVDDADAERSDTVSARLALCNMNWDRINAEDLFVIFTSTKPAQGIIHSVKIFLSEYGKERMAEEMRSGPKELQLDEDVEGDDDDAVESGSVDSKQQTEQLRAYQLNRLRYYYAVIECDTVDTAVAIYEACDGVEYESSASKFDLRFIPDETEFTDQSPTSVCTQLPDGREYTPSEFVTTALHQSHVELTWDEDDSGRVNTIRKKFTPDDIDNTDVTAYLASSSDDDEDEDVRDNQKAAASKYRELLLNAADNGNTDDDDKNVEMEVTWEPGLEQKVQQTVRSKENEVRDNNNMTPWEKFLDKKRQKVEDKRRKKMRREGGLDGEQEMLPAGIDLSDPYFKEEIDKLDAADAAAAGGEEQKVSGKKKKNAKRKNREEKLEDSGETEKQKDELQLLMMDDEEEDKHHFNLKSIQQAEADSAGKRRKRKRRRADDEEESSAVDSFKVSVSDPRFDALYTSHNYNIDPSHPNYKKTHAMESLINEKMKRRKNNKPIDSDPHDDSAQNGGISPEITQLINKIKTKTQKKAKSSKS